ENGFDAVAASFTRSAEDVLEMRAILDSHGGTNVKIIPKIENIDGVNNIEEILKVADGVMVARGDMGVNIPIEEIPRIQKMIIKKANALGKITITATQMLDSMIQNPRPTRAEATDVANAIYDGTGATMLSGETAAGAYPIEAVTTMGRIAERTEEDIDYKAQFGERALESNSDVTNAVAHAAVGTAHDTNAKAILTVTHSGYTARFISKFRPCCPIIGCTPNEQTYRQLNLSWGVIPVLTSNASGADDMIETAVQSAVNAGLIQKGDLVVITGGIPLGIPGTTNFIKVHVVGSSTSFSK
ncbi:MAG: pyruvate kinase, partial [Ethanoligenens sp.]